MSKFFIDNGGSDLVNELTFGLEKEIDKSWQSLKVIVFKGKSREFNYPFKTTKDFLGVLCN